jgi:hypothetical protein
VHSQHQEDAAYGGTGDSPSSGGPDTLSAWAIDRSTRYDG